MGTTNQQLTLKQRLTRWSRRMGFSDVILLNLISLAATCFLVILGAKFLMLSSPLAEIAQAKVINQVEQCSDGPLAFMCKGRTIPLYQFPVGDQVLQGRLPASELKQGDTVDVSYLRVAPSISRAQISTYSDHLLLLVLLILAAIPQVLVKIFRDRRQRRRKKAL